MANTGKIFIIASIGLLFILSPLVGQTVPQDSCQVIERLFYKMSYLGLPSAQAEFKLLKMNDSTSFANTLKFVAKVKTTGISDAIFSIRNRYETMFDELTGLPLASKKKIDQPNLKQTVAIQFDQQQRLASFSNGSSWTIPADCYDLFFHALRASAISTDGRKFASL